MADKFYKLSEEDLSKIKAVNADLKQYVCSCAIQDHKPSFCQQGPLESSRMPDCGYTFENGIRKGQCNFCGRCCVLLRHNGEPFGFYDPGPNGKSCKHLKVEELP